MEKKEEAEAVEPQQETYTQPLVTKHEHLRALTGKSGEKATDEGPDGGYYGGRGGGGGGGGGGPRR